MGSRSCLFALQRERFPSPLGSCSETGSSTDASLGAARLLAVSRGANSLDEDHAAWDWNRQQFSLRIGTSRSVQIPVSETVVSLERQMANDPTITGYTAESPYGLALP